VELKNLIRILAEEGKTILISSHILSELAEMCDSLLFIDKGRIVHHGDAESMTRPDSRQETLVNVQVAGDRARLTEWALTAPQVRLVDELKKGARLCIESADEAVIAATLRRMILDGLPVVDFHREERRLEDAFIDMLGRMDQGQAAAANSPPSIPPPLPPQSPAAGPPI
jgi:ABC-2 type transport system ATP-binding protein